jgi:ribosomal protein S18 acetylase RimI-like enzyme
MVIRNPDFSDAENISECIRASSTGDTHDGSLEGVADWMALSSPEEIRERIASGEINLIAMKGSQVVGYISFKRTNHLSLLYVREGFKRQGIGRQLLQKAAHGLNEITLNSSDEAIPFYLALGFRRTGERFHKKGAWSTPMKWNNCAPQTHAPG